MNTYLYLAVFSLIVSCCNADSDKFIFEDCSKENGILKVDKFTVSPDPISLSDNITVTVDLNLREDIPEGTLLKVNLYKMTSIFGVPLTIPIPCILGTGSCTTEHCKYLHDALEQACPFFPEGVKCGCPLKANKYGAANVIIPMPEMGPVAKRLAKGRFKYEMRLLEKNTKKELACVTFSGKLVIK